jgi:hypothetical protein
MKDIIIIGLLTLSFASCGSGASNQNGNSGNADSGSAGSQSSNSVDSTAIAPQPKGNDTSVQSNRMSNTFRDSLKNKK